MEDVMAHFRELLVYLAPGADPADAVERPGELSHTSIVPVPDVETLVEYVRSVEGVQLVELYGGFGPDAAAAVLAATGDGAVPVGLVGTPYPTPPANLALIYELPGADPAVDRFVQTHDNGSVTVVGVPSGEAAAAVATELVDAGADRIELCGGIGPLAAKPVLDAIGTRVPVATVLFGFESLPSVAAYRARFERTLEEHPELAG
jgi:uncharacterized protein DUF6506